MPEPTTAAPAPLIRVDGLTKRFPGVVALDALTLDVAPGIVGLVGANGAGKSTLIKILLGLLAPTSGRVAVMGYDPWTQGTRLRRYVGYMPEHPALPPDVSATEFVAQAGRLSGLPGKVCPGADGRRPPSRGARGGALPADRRLLHRDAPAGPAGAGHRP